jgi:hypothetical protein
VAKGINDSTPELIAGDVKVNDNRRASLWIDGEYHDLHEQLNASQSWAAGVNNKGIVIGKADDKHFRLNTVSKELEIP